MLYSNLNDRDGGAIVTQLTQMNILIALPKMRSAADPGGKVHETRLRLAQQGCRKGGAVGFGTAGSGKFGISRFREQINYQRALKASCRAPSSRWAGENARVHLALLNLRCPYANRNPFRVGDADPATRLVPDDGQINAIVCMVSTSVAGPVAGQRDRNDQAGCC